MASNFDGIQLTPSDDTKRKIATYAVLTGQNVSIVIDELEEMLNQTLSQKCIELLGGTSSAVSAPAQFTDAPTIPEGTALIKEDNGKVYLRSQKRPKSFADAHKAAAAPPPIEDPEEAFSAIEEGDTHAPQHELSSDEDNQDNKSLEEQIENEDLDPEEAAELKRAFENAKFKVAGNNAEAFLDNAMGDPEEDDTDEIPAVTRGYAGQGTYGERPVRATKSFESRLIKGRRAKVSPHTGEED